MTDAQEYQRDENPEILRQKPLRLEDILPHEEKIYYDKMVPPKEDGMIFMFFQHSVCSYFLSLSQVLSYLL